MKKKKFAKERLNLKNSEVFFVRKLCNIQKFAWNIFLYIIRNEKKFYEEKKNSQRKDFSI